MNSTASGIHHFATLSARKLMLNLSVETWLRFVIWMLGVVIYVAYPKRNSVLGRRERGELPSVEAASCAIPRLSGA